MERRPPMPMTPFDTLITSSDLQMMKLLIPYVPASYQRFMAFYIKFNELQNTFRYFQSFQVMTGQKKTSPPSPGDLLSDLRPYMGEKESGTIDMLVSAMSMMDMMNGMEMPDISGMGDLSGMMDMMNMFGINNDRKGNDDDERMDESSGDEESGSSETGAY